MIYVSDLHIPWLRTEEIVERYSRIKPVVKKKGKLYWLRKFNEEELFCTSFLWKDETKKPVRAGELVPIPESEFKCLHKYGFYGFFKPTVAEVLTQISSDVVDSVAAFEIIDYPEQMSDFYKDEFTTEAFESGFQVSVVRLYKHP